MDLGDIGVWSGALRRAEPAAEIYPHEDLLRACVQAGVPTTLGSDAHAPGEVAADLASACELMRAVGYDRYLTFAGRQREEHPLA